MGRKPKSSAATGAKPPRGILGRRAAPGQIVTAMICVSFAAGCEYQGVVDSSTSDEFFVLLERPTAERLEVSFPVCGGDRVVFGIAREMEQDTDVSGVSHDGVLESTGPQLVRFVIDPDGLKTGSLSSSVAIGDNSARYDDPGHNAERFGELFILTDLGVEGFDLRGNIPPVDEVWVRSNDGVDIIEGDPESHLDELMALVRC